MSDGTAIQWTDATWNPVTGCTKVSPGCAHCYIDTTPAFRIAGRKFVNGTTDIRFHAQRLPQPLSWRRPRRIFVNSLSDLFHEAIPDAFIARVYGVMVAAYWHEFQVLTKRPERRLALLRDEAFRELVAGEAAQLINTLRGVDRVRTPGTHSRSYVGTVNLAAWYEGAARNIWEGVTAENQRWADQRIPVLLATPAAVRFVSCEPLLGPVDLDGRGWLSAKAFGEPLVDWVIVGGESGPGARSCDVDWIRNIVDACREHGGLYGVPVFVKQLGARPCVGSVETAAGSNVFVPDLVRLKDRKGGAMDEWPEDLRVREFPGVGR